MKAAHYSTFARGFRWWPMDFPQKGLVNGMKFHITLSSYIVQRYSTLSTNTHMHMYIYIYNTLVIAVPYAMPRCIEPCCDETQMITYNIPRSFEIHWVSQYLVNLTVLAGIVNATFFETANFYWSRAWQILLILTLLYTYVYVLTANHAIVTYFVYRLKYHICMYTGPKNKKKMLTWYIRARNTKHQV